MIAAPGLLGVIGLRVPGAIAYRHLAIRLVSTACKMALGSNQDDDETEFEPEVVSAFGEAFNNVAMHGHRGIDPAPVQIEVDWDEEKLTITMIDNGHTFDPKAIDVPDLDQIPESGMGFFIMTRFMDEVDYRPGPPNVLRLVKMRKRDGLLPPMSSGGSRHTPPAGAPSRDGGASRSGSFATAITEGDRESGVEVIARDVSAWRTTAAGGGRSGEVSRRK